MASRPYIEVKASELTLDYMRDMTPLNLLQPTTRGRDWTEQKEVVKELLEEWVQTDALHLQQNTMIHNTFFISTTGRRLRTLVMRTLGTFIRAPCEQYSRPTHW